MENENTAIQQRLFEGRYFYSFDILRVVCLTLMIFAGFDLPLPFFGVVRPFLNAATGIMFTLYGFCVLRDGADLTKNIKRAAKVFLVMLAVYLPLTVGYQRLVYGQPFMYFNKRGLFNFVVLNYWDADIGSTIWYVQSTLYALIGFRILRRFKKYDWVACIVLFVLSVLIGELAQVIGFSFLGYDHIPGNFFTRTIPYMLLGRLIYRGFGKIRRFGRALGLISVILGFLLGGAELFLLLVMGKLDYTNHFAGFILVAFGACLMAIQHPNGGKKQRFALYAKRMYKPIYFIYNPLGCLLPIPALFLCRTQAQFEGWMSFVGFMDALICLGGLAFFVRRYYKKHPDALSAEYETMRNNRGKTAFFVSEKKKNANAALPNSELTDFGLETVETTEEEDKPVFDVGMQEKPDEDKPVFEIDAAEAEEKTVDFDFGIAAKEAENETTDFDIPVRDDEDQLDILNRAAIAGMRKRYERHHYDKGDRKK